MRRLSKNDLSDTEPMEKFRRRSEAPATAAFTDLPECKPCRTPKRIPSELASPVGFIMMRPSISESREGSRSAMETGIETQPQTSTPTSTSPGWGSRVERLAAKYREDHRHPVNHFLHVGVGWPMVAASLFLLPFRPLWSAMLFFGAYAFMFSGHFLFERNLPTILKNPATPFLMAYSVTKSIVSEIGRRLGRSPSNPEAVPPK